MQQRFDALVIGAGAAGLMCAIEAGKRGRRVAVIEHAGQPGKKILISGGGRCNFTNIHCTPENFLSANPHFAKSALARYRPSDFIDLVKKHRIPFHEKTLGQLFCDRSARDITGMLRAECEAAGVQIFLNCSVREIRKTTEFAVETVRGEFCAPTLVIATGGLSVPKMGATDFGYRVARQFGLRIRECRPALVPFTFSDEDRRRWCDLAGVSVEAVVSCGKQRFREKLLITHRGLSGPAILQISSYWKPGSEISIRIPEEADVPRRFANRWSELVQTAEWRIRPAGTEGYAKAEVTAGGIDTDELSSKTMESRRVPGLFFIGEVVDVTGHLGGFNFQWAWASGYSAGQAL